jgi:spore protease
MSTKTDLAKEIIGRNFPGYSKKRRFFCGDTEIFEIFIETAEDSRLFNKPKGKYITVEADFPRIPSKDFDEEVFAVSSGIKNLLPEKGDILAVGIGNEFLTADSLGPIAAKNLLCGEFSGRKLFSLVPGVYGRTGIGPEILIRSAAEKLSPSAVILIDSLAAEDIKNVCRSVQISDSGLAPGSGFGGGKTAFTEETLGVPVIAIGTPTVTRLSHSDSVFVSPNDIDILVRRAAKLISSAINLAVFPEAGLDFIKGIIL